MQGYMNSKFDKPALFNLREEKCGVIVEMLLTNVDSLQCTHIGHCPLGEVY